MKNYKAVIFDLDGTLIDSMWIWTDIDIEYLKKHHLELPQDLQKAIEGKSFSETADYFKHRFGITDTVEDIKKEWISMAEDFYSNKVPLKKGAFEYIRLLKEKGIAIGVGTSNSRELALMALKAHGLEQAIEVLVTSCEVSHGKPAPDVFVKVAEMLGVDSADCLVFEDTHAGVLAAKAAGMDVIAIEDEHSMPWYDEIEPLVKMYISNFTEVIAFT